MKRKGETLTEFLTASTVFGLISAGVFEFIANQTETLADIRNKDALMYHANRCMILSRDKATGSSSFSGGNVTFTPKNGKTLTVTLENGASMDFTFKP